MKQIKTYINEKLRLTSKYSYTCQPKSKKELQQIIMQRMEDEGDNCDLNDIDTSKITEMTGLFDTAQLRYFNGDVSMWDVSNVKHMNSMFNYCANFNCDISKWDVSNVDDMRCMFYGCASFKQNIDDWNVPKVKKNMMNAFKDCPTTPAWYDRKRWEY